MASYIPAPYTLDPLGAALGGGFTQGVNQRMVARDLQKLQQYLQSQGVTQQAAQQTGLAQMPAWQGAQPQMPQMRSPQGQQMMMQMMMGQQMSPLDRARMGLISVQMGQVGQAPPMTGLQEAQMGQVGQAPPMTGLQEAQMGQVGKPPPMTGLQEAQKRKTEAETGQIGKPTPAQPWEQREAEVGIAATEALTKQRQQPTGFGLPQTAEAGDELGLPEGSIYQFGPQGELKILYTPGLFSDEYKATHLGELDTGAPSSLLGLPIPALSTKEDHVRHATNVFGPNWKKEVPQAVDIINAKFPKEVPIPKAKVQPKARARPKGSPLAPHPRLRGIWPSLKAEQRDLALEAFRMGIPIETILQSIEYESTK